MSPGAPSVPVPPLDLCTHMWGGAASAPSFRHTPLILTAKFSTRVAALGIRVLEETLVLEC